MKTIFFYFLLIVQISAQTEYKDLILANVEHLEKINVKVTDKAEVKKDLIPLKLMVPSIGNISITNPSRQLKEITKKLALQECSRRINSVESISYAANKQPGISK
ncbi:MAG: hypothetical protein MK207_09335 [Saprospiraceae bacterium]|nr:hypothetical protein [Saprospiraceae bacterium]